MTRSSKWFILYSFPTYNAAYIFLLFQSYGRSEIHGTKI